MALLDLSKVFDRVWREELLLAASFKGLRSPSPAGCATNHQTDKINDKGGDSSPLKLRLPQGVALSTLVTLVYIDDLRSILLETVKVALFADDVSLINGHPQEEGPQR